MPNNNSFLRTIDCRLVRRRSTNERQDRIILFYIELVVCSNQRIVLARFLRECQSACVLYAKGIALNECATRMARAVAISKQIPCGTHLKHTCNFNRICSPYYYLCLCCVQEDSHDDQTRTADAELVQTSLHLETQRQPNCHAHTTRSTSTPHQRTIIADATCVPRSFQKRELHVAWLP